MKERMFMALLILAFLGCSDKEPIPQEPTKKSVNINKSETNATVSLDFVPEHIKRSKIEVVKRY
jgi:uncharacterized protein YcfL